ncbi:hypothetical protein Tco_0782456 [Tanacetum coccineum]
MHDPEVSNPVVTSKYVNDEDIDPKERKAKVDILNLHQDHVARISRARCRPELILCRNGVYNRNVCSSNVQYYPCYDIPHDMGMQCMSLVPKHTASSLRVASTCDIDREVNKVQLQSPIMTHDNVHITTDKGKSICRKPSLETQGKWKHQIKTVKSRV